MKAILFAVAVIVVTIGLFAYIVHRDPNRSQTQAAFEVLRQASPGIPTDPAEPGFLRLGGVDFNREYSTDAALAAVEGTRRDLVTGTLIKQEYQLRQAEYQLAQVKRIGGDITAAEMETKRAAYVDATERLQAFLDGRGNNGPRGTEH